MSQNLDLDAIAAAARAILDQVAAARGALPLALPPVPAGESSRWLSTGQAASLLGLAERTLRAQIHAHDDGSGHSRFDGIEACRVGRNYRVRLASRWLCEGSPAKR